MAYTRADNPATQKPKQLHERFFHDDHPTYVADSWRGLLLARRRGYRWIDTNYHVTSDGVMVCCHWERPLRHGFHDPKGEVKPSTSINDMTWAQVQRLRAPGGYHIRTVTQMIQHAAVDKVGIEIELKGSVFPYDVLASAHALASSLGVEVKVKTISNLGGVAAAHKRLATAHRAGFETIVLPRGDRKLSAAGWWPVTDYVRGKVTWVGADTVPKMGVKAIAAARNQSAHGPRADVWLDEAEPTGWCLKAVRTCYQITNGALTADGAWDAAKTQVHTSDPNGIPRGYPIFWSGGSEGAGHIAISAGRTWKRQGLRLRRVGTCWSTDIRRAGYFDKVRVSTIHDQWGLTLLGYTHDLNGVEIR